MHRDSLKMLLLAGVIGFAVLYGMEMSSNGISKVYGPLDQPASSVRDPSSADQDWTLPPGPAKRQTAAVPAEQQIEIPRHDRKAMVDRISGTAAAALHHLSKDGIRFIVSLFDKMTGS